MRASHETSKKRLRRQVASFGAAMSALTVTPLAHAAIIDLTANLPGPLPFGGSASFGSSFDFVGGPANDLYQFNDTLGKTLNGNSSSPGGDIVGIRSVLASSPITAGQSFFSSALLGYSASGTVTFGFLTNANQVGWIRMNLGGPGGAITYLAAAFNDTPDGNIHAGRFETVSETVPEPSSAALLGLGLLAMGATGVRRLRERRAASA